MEVHHHHIKHRKNWKEYIFEFFMLFLAVLTGFFVENQRERHVESIRAKDFAKTLYTELKLDTTTLSEIRKRTEIAFHSLDTLVELLSGQVNRGQTGLLYYHCGLGMFNLFFTANEATLQEMKSSGAIRYYKNFELVSAITEYEYSIRFLYQLETNSYINFMETRKIQLKIFDNRYIYSSLAWDSSYVAYIHFLYLIKNQTPPLLPNSSEYIDEFRNWARNRSELNRMRVKRYDQLLKSAENLIAILKKEYNLQ
jgi:hypothetical protein